MPGLGNSARQCIFAVLIVTAAIFVGARLELGTNVTHFMPDESASELARLAGELTDSELTRTWVLSVAADHAEEARKAARVLAQQLATDPAVEWVRLGTRSKTVSRSSNSITPDGTTFFQRIRRLRSRG